MKCLAYRENDELKRTRFFKTEAQLQIRKDLFKSIGREFRPMTKDEFELLSGQSVGGEKKIPRTQRINIATINPTPEMRRKQRVA